MDDTFVSMSLVGLIRTFGDRPRDMSDVAIPKIIKK